MVLVLVCGERRYVSSGNASLIVSSLLLFTLRIALTDTSVSSVDPVGMDQEGKQMPEASL